MKRLIVFLFLNILALAAWSAEIYPIPVPVRYSGHHQGNTGSCQSEAHIGALEHGFAARHYMVKLSAAYNHAFNWRAKPGESSINQDYAPEDAAIFSAKGAIIPYFHLPEDGRGFNAFYSGNRPAISKVFADVGAFPAASALGFVETYLTFHPGYPNTMRDLNTIKTWVSQRRATVLSLHGAIFGLFDDTTGLLNEPYSFATFSKAVAENPDPDRRRVRHAVAVVGFDDSLYADQNFPAGPGAFIVRNSWLENFGLASSQQPLNGKDSNIAKMKAKISPTFNEPGYYAIPYQYVMDLIQQTWPGLPHVSDGGVVTLDINYDAFAAAYFSHEAAYEVRRIPFACSLDGIKAKLKRYKIFSKGRRSPDLGLSQMSNEQLKEMMRTQRTQTYEATFQTALLARSKDRRSDRILDFEKGAFDKYYCKEGGSVALPPDVLNNFRFDQLVDEISADETSLGAWMRFYDYMVEALKI